MSSTVTGLLTAAGLEHAGSARWGTPTPASYPGVYLVTLDESPIACDAVLARAPISKARVAELLGVRPQLRLDASRPTVASLADRLAGCWLSDETVLYVGLASTSVGSRVRQYYSTQLGARSPHAGGWYLKTLANLDDLTIHFAAAADPAAAERGLLQAFVDGVDDRRGCELHDPACPYPFANLVGPTGVRKVHGITGARAPR
jgi:hypothetical protein